MDFSNEIKCPKCGNRMDYDSSSIDIGEIYNGYITMVAFCSECDVDIEPIFNITYTGENLGGEQ